MKTTFLRLFAALAWLAATGGSALASVAFTTSPAAVSNTYSGVITLQIGGIPTGDTVVVQKYLDVNGNGVIDGDDWLVQQFSLTDGQPGMVIGGVTNFNVPGDLNAATGAITATLNFNDGDFIQTIAGKFLLKLSSPSGHFAPITNQFAVTNFPFPQQITGSVVSNGTSTKVSNAVVILAGAASGVSVAGIVADSAGSYTVAVPPGTYSPVAHKNNYVANMGTPPVLTLAASQTITTNLSLTSATTSISGRLVDAANSSLGLPGVLVSAQNPSGLSGLAFTDTNGNFNVRVANVRVTAGNWMVHPADTSLIIHGYLAFEYNYSTNAGASGLDFAVPKATALIYGSVMDNLGNPLIGLPVYCNDSPGRDVYKTDGFTDANGNYVLGVHGLGTSDSWWVEANTGDTLTNYAFTQENINGNIYAGQAVLQNFTVILATNFIIGTVLDNNGNPVVGAGMNANATINGTDYQANHVETDPNGNYSMNVANGTWSVSINCGGPDGLSTLGNYACANNQSATINNRNVTNNFVVQWCGSLAIVTPSPLPVGEVNVYYDQFLQAVGTNTILGWTNRADALPPGLSLGANGEIYGIPSAASASTFTVQVTDNSGFATNGQFFLGISNALQVTTTALPNGVDGAAYSLQLHAAAGVPFAGTSPYNWSLAAGSAGLPANLTLAANGLLSGTLTTNGTFNFTVQAADSLAATNVQPLSLTIVSTNRPVLAITNVVSGLQVSNANFLVEGTATDRVSVAAVYCQLNGTGWTPATSLTGRNWTDQVMLNPKTNLLQAYAVNAAGNCSRTNSVTIIYVPSAVLNVQIVGEGALTPDDNGVLLALGGKYAMKAKATNGFAFHYWGGGVPMTTSPTLTFTMTSNLTITAHFDDVTKPVASITYPTANEKWSNSVITATGKASDNVGVAEVWCQVNHGGWTLAQTGNSFTNWTATNLPVSFGTNLLQAYAVDGAGNVSVTNKVKFLGILAPTSLAGYQATFKANVGKQEVMVTWDDDTWAQTGPLGDTNADDYCAGTYTYFQTGPNTAVVSNMDIGMMSWLGMTNFTTVNLTFTNATTAECAWTDNHGSYSGTATFSPVNNLVPATLPGSTVQLYLSGGTMKNAITLGEDGTFTQSNSLNGHTAYGTYTITQYSPTVAILQENFNDPTDAGAVSYGEFDFTSTMAGNACGSYYTTPTNGSNPDKFNLVTFKIIP